MQLSFAFAPKINQTITIDGNADENVWVNANILAMNRKNQTSVLTGWKGIDDLGAEIKFLWDDKNSVLVRILTLSNAIEDIHISPSPRTIVVIENHGKVDIRTFLRCLPVQSNEGPRNGCNAVYLTFSHFPVTLLALAIDAIPIILLLTNLEFFLRTSLFWIVGGVSLMVFINTFLR